MIIKAKVFSVLALVMLSACSDALAQQEELQRCQKLKDDIERYSELRRAGGSGAQMDAWKRARREKERAFRELGCRRHNWQLE